MLLRLLPLLLLSVVPPAGAADAERAPDNTAIPLPPRPPDAATGSEFARQIATLAPAAREAAVRAEVSRGNVPDFWRHFVKIKSAEAVYQVSPDYLAIGDDQDYLFTPLSPASAQAIADELGCLLPTRKMVDAIYQAAPLKLPPHPLAPDAAMTTAPVFARHSALVREQRAAALALHPTGTLVAGHKKDVVITPQLAVSPNLVAIYGWHRPDGTAIQPLYLGHKADWVDYSHGVRLVRREMTVNDHPTTVTAVLADPALCALLSDEGPIAEPRYHLEPPALVTRPDEITEELRFESGVRVILNRPAHPQPAAPVRLVLYALPAGNTIEQTIGHRLQPGDDWHYDIQHIGAQTRWLRAQDPAVNLVIAYLQSDEKSFVLWRRHHPDQPRLIGEIVNTLRQRVSPTHLVLTGHSAGGSFIFGYLDGVERIPADIERIAFLDSNYAYEAGKGHDTKLAHWLKASAAHHLCVIAYQDYLARLNGQTFVSEQGGTWGRSQAMLSELGRIFPFVRTDRAGLQRSTALDGRAVFLLKENPDHVVLHTRLVELNGFIHALLAGTMREGQGYDYLGGRVYDGFIAPK